jgi:hypothetical protein
LHPDLEALIVGPCAEDEKTDRRIHPCARLILACNEAGAFIVSSILHRVTEITASLPIEKQTEVLDFVEFLRTRGVAPNIDQSGTPQRRPLGILQGAFEVPADFDAPLPPEIQRYFEGEDDGVLGEGI